MTFTKLFTIVLLGASIMLAEGHVVRVDETIALERRDFASCAKAKVDTMWKHEKDRPEGASAGICFSGSYDVLNRYPGHYKWVGRLACQEKHGLITYENRFDCFYLIGPNYFQMKTDGGDKNLAWGYTDNCEFYASTNRLTCAVEGSRR